MQGADGDNFSHKAKKTFSQSDLAVDGTALFITTLAAFHVSIPEDMASALGWMPPSEFAEKSAGCQNKQPT
jgi:hypothetical protein